MCYAIGCACLDQTGSLQDVVASSDGRFGRLAPVYSSDVVGSLLDRFRWPPQASHDWLNLLHDPLAFSSSKDDRRGPEARQSPYIKTTPERRITSVDKLPNSSVDSSKIAMEFSKKELEDIQRVAGLLNLTVDELLQQSRVRARNAAQSTNNSPPVVPQRSPGQQASPFSESSHINAIQNQPSFDLKLEYSDLGDPQSNAFGSEPSELMLPPPAAQIQSTKVILLNPNRSSYECDAAVWNFDQSAGQGFPFDDNAAMDLDAADDESYVEVPGTETHSESMRDYTSHEGLHSMEDDSSMDWALVSASPGSSTLSNMTPPASSTAKRYHEIAPRHSRASTQASSESSNNRVKKKRSAYEGRKRIDTHLTRQVHACVRCRMQRNRVRYPEHNPTKFGN